MGCALDASCTRSLSEVTESYEHVVVDLTADAVRQRDAARTASSIPLERDCCCDTCDEHPSPQPSPPPSPPDRTASSPPAEGVDDMEIPELDGPDDDDLEEVVAERNIAIITELLLERLGRHPAAAVDAVLDDATRGRRATAFREVVHGWGAAPSPNPMRFFYV